MLKRRNSKILLENFRMQKQKECKNDTNKFKLYKNPNLSIKLHLKSLNL